MILKKPYGLLIKHFKLIHLIITLLTIYVAVASKSIVDFFSDFVRNNYSTTVFDNIVEAYISNLLYVALFVIIAMLIILYVLLRYKKKPTKMYMIIIIYYIILFVGVILSSYLIGSLKESMFTTASARQFRDISALIYWPQYLCILLLAIRALGFNVRKFNFQEDIRELELSEADSEEIEVNLNFDTDKAKRRVRRSVREFKYYFRENKFIVFVILGITLAGIGYLIYRNYEKKEYIYKQSELFNYSGFSVKIEDSIFTNLSYNGTILEDNYFYLLVKLNVKNNTNTNKALDYTNFKIYMNDSYYVPSLDVGSNFIDYAKPYTGERIDMGKSSTFFLPYKIAKDDINKDFKITIYTGTAVKSDNFEAKTINVALSPIMISSVANVSTYDLNEFVTFNATYLYNTSLKITDYVIASAYPYKYEYCYNNDCKEYIDIVNVNYTTSNNQTLIALGYEFNIDQNSSYYESYKTIDSFVNQFVRLNYTKNGVSKTVNVKNVTPSKLTNKLVLQTTDEINTAEKIDLYITIRNKNYVINIKK